ncbi:hypothetical protein MASR2M29_02640 [Spirochaetota bacterium]
MYHSLIQALAAARLLNRPHGVSVQEATEHLGLSVRSIYRLFDALSELGYPLFSDPERGHRYFLVDPGSARHWWIPLPSVELTMTDRVLLDWIFEYASRQPELSTTITQIRRKLSFVGASTGYSLEPKAGGAGNPSRSPRMLVAGTAVKRLGKASTEIFQSLVIAIGKRSVCEVSYASRESGKVKTWLMHPLQLFEAEGGLYVFVQAKQYGSIRILALERIYALKVLVDRFNWPVGFDPHSILSDPFGMIQEEKASIVLKFTDDQAAYIRERSWPDGYEIEGCMDGSLIMRIETGGIFGLTRWILGWGSSVRVLEPDWLRNRVADELERTIALYR